MKFITLNSESVALCLAPPNWSSPITVELNLPANINRAISRRESRRVFATSVRYSLAYSALFPTAKDSTDFRLWLTRIKAEPVAVPLWTDAVEIASALSIGAGTIAKTSPNPVRYGSEWIILTDDGATYEIVTVTAIDAATVTLSGTVTLNWPAGTLMYPLLFGRIVERPETEAITDEMSEATLKFRESSSFARRLNPYATALQTVGSAVADFSTLRLWNVRPNFVRVLDRTESDVLWRQIGFGREEQKFAYAQYNARGVEFEFSENSRANIAIVENLFADRKGSTKPLMVPTFRGDVRLAADLPGDGIHLTIEASSRFSDANYLLPGTPYIAVIDASTIEPRKLTTIAGTTLTAAVASAVVHATSDTIISHLLLARLTEAKLTWSYLSDGLASTRLKFIELPDEYADPQTDLQEDGYLYKFTEQLDTPQSTYFTSYENALVFGGNSYTPGPFSHGSIKASLRVDQEKCELTSWGGNFPTNPLKKLFPLTLDAPLELTITRVNAASPNDGNAEVLFVGDVQKLDTKGADWKASVSAFARFFEHKFPRFLIQRPDNFTIYTRPTGLVAADFDDAGVIDSITERVLVVSALADYADNYFAAGFVELGSGATFERRAILDSERVDATHQTITLDRVLVKHVVAAAINLFPGYDGSIEECDTKFANRINFGGHPYAPDTNPTIKAVEAKEVTGGKK